MAKLEEEILSEGKLESDAQQAKKLVDEYSDWMMRAQEFIKVTGNQPQEPLNFLRNVMLTFAMKKLESKIISLR